MADPFVGEIRMWACDFAPKGWAFCTGQLLPISQNTALFSIIGTYYGGDGKTTFALPDLRGNVPMAWGTSTSGTTYDIGEAGGAAVVTLTEQTVPAHTHAFHGIVRPGNTPTPTPETAIARVEPSGNVYKVPAGAATPQPLAANAIVPMGGSQPHNNLMPFIAMNYCIALQGIFPQRP